jgi:hypothetical protein
MDAGSALGSVFAAFGLSGAAGLNAFLPLLAGAVLARTGVVDLGAPFDDLQTNGGLVALAVLFALDFVGDKIPALDHVLHVVGGVVARPPGRRCSRGRRGSTPTSRRWSPCWRAAGWRAPCTSSAPRSGRCRR